MLKHDFIYYKGDDITKRVQQTPRKPVQPKNVECVEELEEYLNALKRYQEEYKVWEDSNFEYCGKMGERYLQFLDDLKESLFDSSWMTDETWSLLYQEAYDRGHGFEDIHCHMIELINFSKKVHESAR